MMRVKNWAAFQHFKSRTPPWIKLYRDLLNDEDWHLLDGATAKTLIGLWLLASEDKDHQGRLPDTRKIAFRLRITEQAAAAAIEALGHWLIRDDIKMISRRYQDDTPEGEGETEREAEGEADGERQPAAASTQETTNPQDPQPGQPAEVPLSSLVRRVKSIRPEFAILPDAGIINAYRAHPQTAWEAATADFARDMANALTPPRIPAKVLAGYLAAASKPRGQGATSRPLFPGEAVKVLAELRGQGERIRNRHGREENRRLILAPEWRAKVDAINAKIAEVEAGLAKTTA